MSNHGFNHVKITSYEELENQIAEIYKQLMIDNSQELKIVFLNPKDYLGYFVFGNPRRLDIDPNSDYCMNNRGIKIVKDEMVEFGNIRYYRENTKVGSGMSIENFLISFSQQDIIEKQIDEAFSVSLNLNVSVTVEGLRKLIEARIDPVQVIRDIAESNRLTDALNAKESVFGQLIHQSRKKKFGLDNFQRRVDYLISTKKI